MRGSTAFRIAPGVVAHFRSARRREKETPQMRGAVKTGRVARLSWTSVVVLSAKRPAKADYDPSHEGVSVSVEEIPSEKVVGFLGGGQLGRMAALAAANLGVKVKCLDPTPNAPASVAADQTVGDFRDAQDILEFARHCDVLTVEIEHVDVEALRAVSQKIGISVHPSPETIEIIQDKYRQKQHLQSHHIPVVQSTNVPDMEALEAVCEQRLPVMLKAKRLAYDGRGNSVIRGTEDIGAAVEALGGFQSQLYVEQWVPFCKELAVIVARSVHGEVLSYPVTETIHKDSICFLTETPAAVSPEVLQKARKLAEQTVRCLNGGGIFGVELFLMEDETILVNEVAPRPHNSGHYTIDGCYTSQFEQHIRAILGWPLGSTDLVVGNAIMYNLLGEAEGMEGLRRAQSVIQKALRLPGAMVHWYEKSTVQPKRKVGHINLVGASRMETRSQLRTLNDDAFRALAGAEDSPEDAPSTAEVAIIMGSDSDLATMKDAAEVLESFGVSTEVTVVSAHRTPERMMDYAKTAHRRGIKVIIAGAGGAAHLPGMVASLTPLPVIGVPCVPVGSHLDGLDALMSIVQMPKGVPVATVGIGNATNAGLLAARMLGIAAPSCLTSTLEYQSEMKQTVMDKINRLQSRGWKSY